MSSSDRVGSGFVPGIAIPTVLIICALAALLLAGCSAPWGSASPPSPTPSPTPAPVQVVVTLAQTGRVADGTLAVTATVTVTNHLTQAISLISLCGYSFQPPYIKLDLYVPPSDVSLWRNASHAHNPFCTSQDLVRIAPGSSQAWSVPVDLSSVPAKDVVPGATYRVVAYVQWHTGPLPPDVVEAAKILQEPSAQAEITLT